MANELTVTNLTNNQVGVAGKVIAAGASKTIPLRIVQGHPTYASSMSTLINANKIAVSLDGTPLSAAEVLVLDAATPESQIIVKEIWENPAAADDNGIVTSIDMDAAGLDLSGADLDGAIGGGTMDPPRNITITTTTEAGEAIEGGDAVITGLDVEGNVRSETITIAALGAGTSQVDTGAICFKQVTRVQLPTDASGSPGAAEVGFGSIMGFSNKLQYGGLVSEHVDNAVPGTAGTVVLSGTSAPNGTYDPNTAPNGAHDYVVCFIPD